MTNNKEHDEDQSHKGVLLEVREVLKRGEGIAHIQGWPMEHSIHKKIIARLEALIEAVPDGLSVGLMNAVSPTDETEEKGDENNAQAVLDAANFYTIQQHQGSKPNDQD